VAIRPLEPRIETPPEEQGEVPALQGDIRASRPFFLSPAPLRLLARRTASVLSLVLLDVLAVALGLYITLVLKELALGHWPILWGLIWTGSEYHWFPFLAALTVVVFSLRGLYARREQRGGFGRILSSIGLVAILALAYELGGPNHQHTYSSFPVGVLVVGGLIGLFRASYDSITRDVFRKVGIRRRVILVGEGESLRRLRAQLGRGRGGIDYLFLGVVAETDPEAGLPVLGSLDALGGILASGPVDELIVTDDFKERELLDIVEQAHRRGLRVRVAPKTTELLVTRGEYTPQQGLPLFELRPPVLIGTDWIIKRGFDLTVSTLVLLLGLPFWIVFAIAIKVTSRGPVFYRDRRVGVGEREFAMLKFRTMYVDAHEQQAALEERNEADGPLFKIRDDPRITPVGKILRRLSLDEVPQLLNVLRGEMSIVGPRPLPLRDYVQLEEWHRKRYLVLPGITGLWQVSGRIALPFDDLVRLDFYYLENWSIWLDISILAKTLPAVLARRGAY
jgi:exopolysaccharide biosynthesis polyprenyl glycosylphosphotransferase